MYGPPIQRGRSFWRDRRGSVTIISAFVLPILIGVVALVAEFGHGLLIRVENQRVADAAAYAGALAYNSSSSTTTMNSAIANVATLNGLPSTAVTGALVASPRGGGKQAVSVNVQTSKLLLLAPVIRSGSSLPVASSAFAEISSEMAGCIIALRSAGTGVTLSGGTAVTAQDCTVASNSTVSVPCGTSIRTKAVDYNSSSAPSQPCSGIQPPSGTASVKITRTTTTDPLASDTAVTALRARLTTVNGYSAPTVASGTGTAVEFTWNLSPTQTTLTNAGCSSSFNSGTWTVTCPGTSAVTLGSITVGGGVTVNFNTSGSASKTYNINGPLTNNGTAITFGPGTFNLRQGLTTGGGSQTTFGAGTFNIGTGTSSCSGAGTYSICNTGTSLTFGGPSTFKLTAGMYNGGGSEMTLGSGTSNSYEFGPSSGGDAITVMGGTRARLHDALGSKLFKIVGNITTAGGSCLAVPAATNHDIKGSIAASGGVILGTGIYTVTGYVALGANGGGDVSCWGSNVGMSGSGVNLVIGASTTISGGTCGGTAFCVGSGYGNVSLTAPTSGTNAKLLIIGPASSSNSAGATFTQGASNTSLSGAFYLPNGPINMSGGASVGNGSGQCLQFIGSQVTLSGGSAVASTCVGSSSGTSGVVLVQ